MALKTVSHAFSDTRAFVVPHDRPEPSHPLDALFTSQDEDGPTFIRVGVECSDEYLLKVWEERRRFPGLTMEQLMAARDVGVQLSEVTA